MNAIFAGKTIVIGITGGIAGYKIVDVIKALQKQGARIEIILTRGAQELFDKKLFEKSGVRVWTDVFEENFSYTEYVVKKRKIPHIILADATDLFLIAPATANILAKVASGITDDLLTTAILATNAPVVFCPSMNVKMWKNVFVQANIGKLKKANYTIVDPDSGDLACGYKGIGRLPKKEKIISVLESMLSKSNQLKGKKVLVTAGATIENIDPVRVITNKSSGKMGVAIADQAYLLGADVTLLRGKQSVLPNYFFGEDIFTTGSDLLKKIKQHIKDTDIFIHTAAVSDFSLEKTFNKKIDSSKKMTLYFLPTKKILDEIKRLKRHVYLVGFKAEFRVSEKELIEDAYQTLKRSGADLIVANDVGKKGRGFDTETNEVYIIDKKKKVSHIPLAEKSVIAERLLEMIVDKLQ